MHSAADELLLRGAELQPALLLQCGSCRTIHLLAQAITVVYTAVRPQQSDAASPLLLDSSSPPCILLATGISS